MSDRLTTHTDQPCGKAGAHITCPPLLFPCPFCHNTTLQQYRLPSVTKTVTESSHERTPQKRAYHRQLPHE